MTSTQADLNFAGKHVLVTGGSRGIGLEISKAFAQAGAKVIIVYRTNLSRAEEAIHQLDGTGHTHVSCDVSDAKQVAQLFDQIQGSYGTIDIVVNNAGIGFHHPIDESSYDHWQMGWGQILGTNLIGPANISYQAKVVGASSIYPVVEPIEANQNNPLMVRVKQDSMH